MVYHGKLGTQGERVGGCGRSRAIAGSCGRRRRLAGQADRAALLAKADLLTDMVGEFPELQGIMGGYYARPTASPTRSPRRSRTTTSRASPATRCRATGRRVVALADKLETLVGLFGIGQMPTGDKDPFALRRHALGVSAC